MKRARLKTITANLNCSGISLWRGNEWERTFWWFRKNRDKSVPNSSDSRYRTLGIRPIILPYHQDLKLLSVNSIKNFDAAGIGSVFLK